MHDLRVVVLGREVREHQESQMGGPVILKKIQRLSVGKMPLFSTDAPFQVNRVRTSFQHRLIVVRFQEGCMAAADMMNDLVTGHADIGEDPRRDVIERDRETMGIRAIVFFG